MVAKMVVVVVVVGARDEKLLWLPLATATTGVAVVVAAGWVAVGSRRWTCCSAAPGAIIGGLKYFWAVGWGG